MNKVIGLRSETPTYDRSVFEGIRNLCGQGAHAEPFTKSGLRIEDGGVFAEAVGLEGLDWMPAVDADAPGSANPLVAPSLPFPFTAAQLAAFFLDGWGQFIFERFGDWESGPDEDLLRSAGVRGTKVREAVREAYRAYREAQQVVGVRDETLRLRAMQLGEAIDAANYEANKLEGVLQEDTTQEERERGRVFIGDMSEHARLDEQAEREAKVWRKSMVRHLLGLEATVPLADQPRRVGPESGSGTGVVVHSTRGRRRDILTPLIEKARAKCADGLDTAEVWAHLQRFAEEKVPPFLGVATEAGLEFRDGDEIRYFKRKDLTSRLARVRAKIANAR